MIFEPTEEQEAIFAATRASRESLIIDAYAGVGKSTTLELAAPGVRVPALALAFNRSIRDELAKRFPPNFSIMSMNGLGMKALARAHRGPSLRLDEKKLGKVVTSVAKEHKLKLEEEEWVAVRALTSRAMLSGIVPGNGGATPLSEDSEENWAELVEELFLPEDQVPKVLELAKLSLIENNRLVREEGLISFDDQVYYSTCVSGNFPLFPVLFVDEAQDLSGLNHAMLAKSLRPDGRIVAVGDKRQAIYSFRGAHSDSFGRIRALRGNWLTLPLATTFRCPRVVVKRQQEHAPGFRAAPTAPEGLFGLLRSGEVDGLEAGWGARDLFSRAPRDGASIAILCRHNAPLLEIGFKLLRQRVSIRMLGRDIGQGLAALSKKIFPEGASAEQMLGALAEWELTEISKATLMGQEEKIDGIVDKAESIRAVLGFAEVSDREGLQRALKALFSRESGAITLSSIHRAKGLEWDLVVHLDPWRVPSRRAREAARLGNSRELTQELNLRYVAETRTRHTLLHAELKEFE